MTFNNRIIRKEDKDVKLKGLKTSYSYFIHEVYYDDKGNIEGWTQDGMVYVGESRKELWENILFRLEAFKAPILELIKVKGKEKLIEVKE